MTMTMSNVKEHRRNTNRQEIVELNLQDLNNAIEDLQVVAERESKYHPSDWKIDELKSQIAKLQVVKAAMKGGCK